MSRRSPIGVGDDGCVVGDDGCVVVDDGEWASGTVDVNGAR